MLIDRNGVEMLVGLADDPTLVARAARRAAALRAPTPALPRMSASLPPPLLATPAAPDAAHAAATLPGADGHLIVRDGRQRLLVPIRDVLWLESHGSSIWMYTAAGRRPYRGTLVAAAHELAPHGFVRIHRQSLVNGARIVALQSCANGVYEARLDSGHRLRVSRSCRAALLERLASGGAGAREGAGLPRAAEDRRSARPSASRDPFHDTLDVLVLWTLTTGPRYGDDIGRWLAETAGEAVAIEDGSLLSALYRLERRGHVAAEWGIVAHGQRAKIYSLTPVGRRALAQGTERWRAFADGVSRVLRPARRAGDGDRARAARVRVTTDHGERADVTARRRRREPELVRAGSLAVSLTARAVWRHDRLVDLPPKAFELLVALVRHSPRAVSREELLRDVWGHHGDARSRTVDTHVLELRRRLEEDPARPRHIRTVSKVGYRFVS